jgi:homoserine kinase
LLPLLLPLAEDPAILGVALSGAGPSVLLIAGNPSAAGLDDVIRQAAQDPRLEIVHTTISTGILQS